MKFGVCPHDVKKGLDRWKTLAQALESRLGEKVELITFKDFDEEKGRILKEGFDLYYASPETATALFSAGYVPIGRLIGDSDFVYLLKSRSDKKERFVRVATANLFYLHLALDMLREFSGGNISLLLARTHEEAYELVREGKAHYGLVLGKEVSPKEGEVEVLGVQNLRTFHLFMAKRSRASLLKKALMDISEDFEPMGEEAIELLLKLKADTENLLKEWENHDIANAVLTAPHVGIVIYQERVVYANDYACELFRYSREEISRVAVHDLVAEEFRESIRAVAEARLRGEGSERIYDELKAVTKDGRHIWLLVFAKTIIYRGRFSGLVIFLDVTRSRKLRALYDLLREINQIITSSVLEEELFEKVCSTFVEKVGLRFVWVGRVERGEVKPISWCGYEEGYLKRLRINLDPDKPEGRGPTASALRKGRIVINPDTQSNPSMGPWRAEMLKRGYRSSCAIPIQREGRTVYVINLYADEPLFFEEELESALEEVKRDIEFALKNIQEFRKGFVIKTALEKSDNWTLITDGEGIILYVNETVARISGYTKEELIGKKPSVFKSGLHSRGFYKDLWETILSGREFRAIFVNRAKDGSLFHIEQTITPIELPGGALRFVAVGREISREIELKDEIERLKFYDPLTGLFNFSGFSFKVMEALKAQRGYGVLILIDVHGMTYVNGTFGFDLGDRLLKEVARRLTDSFREEDVVARVGGDEFCVLAYPIKDRKDALALSEKLKDLFAEPFPIDGKELTVGMNAGISLFPDDGKSFSELYNKAYLALTHAKEKGAGEVEFFNRDLEQRAVSFVRTESLLERATRKNLFLFFFQPYYRLSDMKLAGVELLLRIRDEEGRIHGPAEFIDYLERSRFLHYFEEWSLEQLRRLLDRLYVPLSFNVSARSFSNEDYMNRLYNLCSEYEDRVIIEITERLLVDDLERTRKFLDRFRKKAKVAVDDFGTGYSSLAYIKDLPVDRLKIDMSFIRSMMRSSKDRALVETVIQFARKIGMESHAEGVESEEQLQLLKKMGCTYAQGFYLAKPVSEEELERILEG